MLGYADLCTAVMAGLGIALDIFVHIIPSLTFLPSIKDAKKKEQCIFPNLAIRNMGGNVQPSTAILNGYSFTTRITKDPQACMSE